MTLRIELTTLRDTTNRHWFSSTVRALAVLSTFRPAQIDQLYNRLARDISERGSMEGLEPLFLAVVHEQLRLGRVEILSKAMELLERAKRVPIGTGDLMLTGADKLKLDLDSWGRGAVGTERLRDIIGEGIFGLGDFSGGIDRPDPAQFGRPGEGVSLSDLRNTGTGQVSSTAAESGIDPIRDAFIGVIAGGVTSFVVSVANAAGGLGLAAATIGGIAGGVGGGVFFLILLIQVIIAALRTPETSNGSASGSDSKENSDAKQAAPADPNKPTDKKPDDKKDETKKDEDKKNEDKKNEDKGNSTPNPMTEETSGTIPLSRAQIAQLGRLIREIRGVSDVAESDGPTRASPGIIRKIVVVDHGDIDWGPEGGPKHQEPGSEGVATFTPKKPVSDQPEDDDNKDVNVDVVINRPGTRRDAIRSYRLDYVGRSIFLIQGPDGALVPLAQI